MNDQLCEQNLQSEQHDRCLTQQEDFEFGSLMLLKMVSYMNKIGQNLKFQSLLIRIHILFHNALFAMKRGH